MGLRDYFRSSRKNSAAIAKERLQILVAHERRDAARASYLPQLQEDILAVIRKYVAVEQNAVTVQVEREDDQEILELNIVLPESNQATR